MEPSTLERDTQARVETTSEPPPEVSGGLRPSWRVERWLLQRMWAAMGGPNLSLQLWDGVEVPPRDESPPIRVVIQNRPALWKLIFDPLFQFGEGYSNGHIDVEGDLGEFLLTVNGSYSRVSRKRTRVGILPEWVHWSHRNTLTGSQKNIRHHYDIGNDFYQLWLDEQLAYTCAYFPRPSQTLEEAQIAKMDHVCRKLWLQPGETVVEAGCGWGALALHMAKHFGVQVKAYNISSEQIAFARRRAEEEELDDRVEFIQADWRTITGRYDVFVSIGMLEHVGLSSYRLLGDVIDRSLSAEGRGLIHSIGQNFPRPFDHWTERRIFPGAYPPTLSQMMDIFETNDFSVLDVENLRLHYAETLRHWWKRYEESIDVVGEMFDERFVRMWRLYLAASMAAFQSGTLQLFQVLFTRGSYDKIPRTREYQYSDIDLRFSAGRENFSSGEGQWNSATS